MERHRHLDLYKDSFRSPRNYKESLREQKIEARAKQHDAHRRISVSPMPERLSVSQRITQFEERLTSTPLPPKANNKENVTYSIDDKIKEEKEKKNCVVFSSSQIAQVACAPNGTSLNRKEAYLKRFIEWRNKKKQEEVKKKEVRNNVWKPVGPLTTGGSNVAGAAYSSFATKNCKFQPPAGLKQYETKTKTKPKEEEEKKRESFYKIICTPEKKSSKPEPSNSLARKVMQQALTMKNEGLITISHVKPSSSKAIINKKHKESQVRTKPTSMPKTIVNKPTSAPAPISVNKTKKPPVSSKTPLPQKPLAKPKNVGTTEGFIKPEVKPPLVASSVRRPNGISKNANSQKAPTGTTSNSTNKTGAIGKAKVAQEKRIGGKSAANNHNNIKLGTIMKATKRTNGGGGTTNISKATLANGFKQMISDKKVQKIRALKQTNAAKTVAEIPTESVKHVPEKIKKYVTSTQHKCDHAADDFVVDSDISPIELSKSPNVIAPKQSLHTSSSAKRALLLPKSKFNFVRYSTTNTNEVDSSLLIPMPAELDQLVNNGDDATLVAQKHHTTNNKPKKVNAISLVEDATLVNDNATIAEVCTPPPVKADNDERPANYLSPFVSVSRGKVNFKSERERRNSMYLANDEETPKMSSDSEVKTNPQTPIEVRRTLESVRYFRQQLQDETTRLRDKCVAWESYKIKNLTMLQEINCDDKIDATVGQTLLLTGNKFEQFKRLINRCEAGVTGIGALEDNGSEDTKSVSAVDLEGFWAMLGLQIENVEKRFEEIERWKANNWHEPDVCAAASAPAAKSKSKIIKTKQPKAAAATKTKASSGILELMRKKHAELRKMKCSAGAEACDSNSRSNGEVPLGTPKRRSFIVPNCKQFSPAATVLSITNGKRRSLTGPKGNRNVPTSSGEFDLRKTAILGAKKTTEASTPPPQPSSSHQSRKSILKTPGTTSKSARKSVVFSSKNLVRRFQFTFDEPTLSDDDELQQHQLHKEGGVNITNEFEDTTADMTASEQSCSGFNNFKTDSGGGTPARCYTLRNRKVKLRPSYEIIIPQ